MADHLEVRLHGYVVGELSIAGEFRSPDDWRFQYGEDYLETERPMAVSVSLPMQPEVHAGAGVRNWFCNLLPEGLVREAIETRLKLRPRDDFGLLEAIGGECAGAVSIGGQGEARLPPESEEQRDLDTLVFAQGPHAGEGALAVLGTPHRLSLAGAQDKIPVVRGSGGQLLLPGLGEPSTHILKPESPRLRHLCELEALGLRLAKAIGLPAVECALVDVGGRTALLVERYDRETSAQGNVVRIHQEDFCQALGYPGELKYESQGGPSLGDCAGLIRHRLRLGPRALQQFLDWIIYCVVIGNADAHAKNLSLLHRPGRIELAPYYDLVPTVAIPDTLIARDPALRIGGAARIDQVERGDWHDLARDTGFGPALVGARVASIAEAASASVARVAQQLEAEGGHAATLANAVSAIRDNAQRLL
jgi:serine/threonine-protein kinase HipA